MLQVRCLRAGPAKDSVEVVSEPLPATLEWGEVLVTMQYAPINPADIYTVRTGGVYGDTQCALPFVAGHDGVGIITKVSSSISEQCIAVVTMDEFVCGTTCCRQSVHGHCLGRFHCTMCVAMRTCHVYLVQW